MSKSITINSLILVILLSLTACKENNSKKAAYSPSPTIANSADKLISNGYQVTNINSKGLEIWVKSKDTENGSRFLEEGTVLNGLKEGSWITYHDDKLNLISSIANYNKGILDGAFTKYESNGVVTDIKYFVNGVQEGISKKYEKARLSETAYYKNGKLNGPRKTYYIKQNKIKIESNYINGKRDGIERYYDEEGNISIEYKYKKGVRLKR